MEQYLGVTSLRMTRVTDSKEAVPWKAPLEESRLEGNEVEWG